jgi:hypothetical protein
LFRGAAWAAIALVSAAVLEAGCGSEVVTGSGAASVGGAGGAAHAAGASSGGDAGGEGGQPEVGGGGAEAHPKAYCGGNKLYKCGDGIDNDGDGLVDAADPECLGSCDNSEDSFHPGIGDTTLLCNRDCFWDVGNAHDEDCWWDMRCDPEADLAQHSVANPIAHCKWDSAADGPVDSQVFPPSEASCAEMESAQSPACLSACLSVAPNGCDCFGCCELDGHYVWFGSELNSGGTCGLDAIGKPDFFDRCHPCTPVPSCHNPCDACELCVDRWEVPSGCSTGTQLCPAGSPPCGLPQQVACAEGQYCITGCCIVLPL